ncbi:MAG: hypothetical protein GC185_00615 [Alphaproteobacteria bacterium]|nr:hypothetical protein [Alphaproteobacteria bacterium]
MKPRREKEPPISAGDEIHIERGGGAGRWKVRAARYERADSDKISLVLSRGSQAFKTAFNAETMRQIDNTPAYMLSREITLPKKIRLNIPKKK